jgi:hypothetical protein
VLNHPLVGQIELEPLALQVFGSPDLIFLVYMPMPGTDSTAKLEALSSSAPMPFLRRRCRTTVWRSKPSSP